MIGQHPDRGHVERTHIDVVPLVDCIMVLLIFLMISSAFINDPGIEVQKPDVAGVQTADSNALFIAISADNRIFFDGQQVRADQIAGAIKQSAIGNSPAVIIRADRACSHGVFAEVYSQVKHAGIKHVQFSTNRTVSDGS